jgi:hypothetical protein
MGKTAARIVVAKAEFAQSYMHQALIAFESEDFRPAFIEPQGSLRKFQ